MVDWHSTARAGGYHLTNVLLHAATAMLLFFVLGQMTGRVWPSAWWRHVRGPSFAGGIGGLGHGAKRRPQRSILHADAGGVCGLCASPAIARAIPAGDGLLCPRAFVQGDAGDAAAATAVVGLLAAGTVRKQPTPLDLKRNVPKNAPPVQWGERSSRCTLATSHRKAAPRVVGGRHRRGHRVPSRAMPWQPTNSSLYSGASTTP